MCQYRRMADRLSALDASFLYLEDEATPMHIGGVAIFRKPRSGFDYNALVRLLERKLDLVPRYRQRVLTVPGHLARPVWSDDPEFDITHHVRRSALPKPGGDDQLYDLAARLMAKPLDRSRPLWEAYFVEGLARGRVALLAKSHQALVDGIGTIDIGQVVLEAAARSSVDIETTWVPTQPPSSARLVVDAVAETIRRPREIVENVRAAVTDAEQTARKAVTVVGDLVSAIGAAARVATTAGTTSGGPLNVRISAQRRFAVARAKLDDFRKIRAEHGGTVNDAVLATLTGALRNWLLSRGEPVDTTSSLRALVPLAVREPDTDPAVPGILHNTVYPHLINLPIGEPNAVMRLHQVGHAMRGHNDSGNKVAAEALLRIGGFAPPTLHSLGARAANSFSRRIFNVLITNVPGPQLPMYAGPARLLEMFPVVPLARNQALAIGVTSYHGGVYFGLNGDRAAMSDVDVLARMVEESLEELTGTVKA
jgi:diacylglycerol O-acyltransferase